MAGRAGGRRVVGARRPGRRPDLRPVAPLPGAGLELATISTADVLLKQAGRELVGPRTRRSASSPAADMGVQLFKLSLATLAVVSSFTAPGAPAPAPRSLVRRHMDLDTVRLVGDGAAAFVGGSMGVAGTLAVYENNRFHAKQRVVCAYCASAPRNPFRAARPPPPPVTA